MNERRKQFDVSSKSSSTTTTTRTTTWQEYTKMVNRVHGDIEANMFEDSIHEGRAGMGRIFLGPDRPGRSPFM